MKLSEVQRILRASVIWGEENLDMEIEMACGADLMSDVLVFAKQRALLLTGLINPQVVRTAEIGDLVAIVFVRGKCPGEDVIKLAKEKGIPLLSTSLPMYESCGLLFKHGLAGCKMELIL